MIDFSDVRSCSAVRRVFPSKRRCAVNAGTEPSQPAELHDTQKEFVRRLIKIGRCLRDLPTREAKSKQLMFELYLLNHQLPSRVWLPIYKSPHVVLRIPFIAGCVLNSKDKAPYCIYLEVLDVDNVEHAVLPPKGLDPELVAGRRPLAVALLASTSAPAHLDAVGGPPLSNETETDNGEESNEAESSAIDSGTSSTADCSASLRSGGGENGKADEEDDNGKSGQLSLVADDDSPLSLSVQTPFVVAEDFSCSLTPAADRTGSEAAEPSGAPADILLSTESVFQSAGRQSDGPESTNKGEEEEEPITYTSFDVPSTSAAADGPPADMLDMDGTYSPPETDELPNWFRTLSPGSQRRRRQQIEHSAEDPSASTMSEPWEEKVERMRRISPYGHLPNWRLKAVIVKTGDDLNHEKLVYKFLRTLKEIWQEENLKLYLRPYRIFVLSNDSGLIEPIPNACSLHQIMWNMAEKPRYDDAGQRYAPTLLNHFFSSYGSRFAPKFLTAQKNFLRSCAAYCLVCYFLQVKDRHNGNILLDHDGHLIHIDFGFILSQSPGNLNFESSPFKLTHDLLEVMNGPQSELFAYFKWLLKRGLQAARKHHKRLIAAVERLVTKESFGPNALRLLEDRLFVHNAGDDNDLQRHVESMVYQSRDSFTTRLYDNFQYLTNGIR